MLSVRDPLPTSRHIQTESKGSDGQKSQRGYTCIRCNGL